jgi:hypothetical protein
MATIDGTPFDDVMTPTIGQYSQGGVVTPRPENQTTNLPDLVHGLEGSDSIDGGDGDDTLDGGQGPDTLNGGPGADEFHHSGTIDDGDDIVHTGDNGIDTVAFTTPDLYDLNYVREGDDLIVGAYDPTTEEFTGTLRIVDHYRGAAIAVVQIDTADFNLDYGTDPEVARFYFTTDLANGINNTDATEVLLGTESGDVINGNGGFYDVLIANGGNDTVTSGDSSDFLAGGTGDDKLFGGDRRRPPARRRRQRHDRWRRRHRQRRLPARPGRHHRRPHQAGYDAVHQRERGLRSAVPHRERPRFRVQRHADRRRRRQRPAGAGR